MEFFGDREREELPREVAEEIGAALAGADAFPPGPRRHGAIAAALVRAGALAQGIADAAPPDRAEDAPRPVLAATVRLARGLWRSWGAGGAVRAPAPGVLRAALETAPGAPVRIRRPEGYALYALYPETYAVAARTLAGRRLTVVGIRSIGTSLAAAVAAGAGSRCVPLTVRPAGHPHARRLEPTPALARAAAGGGDIAVVDEGPGLSGSSFAAVARVLLQRGVAPDRIHLFTSHPFPPGVRATPEDREIFGRVQRHFVPFDALFLRDGPLALARFAEDALGPARVVEELSGGAWRRHLFGAGPDWPPSEGWLERRKLLLDAGGVRYVARFAGLADVGERKLARAHALAAAGAGIPPVALRHGFLFEPWLGAARPLPLATVTRTAVLDAVCRVLAVSAARPRPATDGASPGALVEMARVNAGEALGPEGEAAARRLEELLPDVAREARPVEVDGKPQAWEWLVLPRGRVVKTDAVDHHAAHDLAGCQDALWDVAGAQVELGLSDHEALRLAEAVRDLAPGADPSHLPFYRVCFLALEVGRWSYAAATEPLGPERGRREAALARYRRALGGALVALVRGRRPAPALATAAEAEGARLGGGRGLAGPVSPAGGPPCPGSAQT
jgi:hypothetical protein